MFNNWIVLVGLYVLLGVIYNQFYKVILNKSRNTAATVILFQVFAGISVLIYLPFFEFKLPSDLKIYLLLLLASIFYALGDKFLGEGTKKTEISVQTILSQTLTIFMIIFGVIFFRDRSSIINIMGGLLIVIANALVLWEKGRFRLNKYALLIVLGRLCIAVAFSIDIDTSKNFNLPFYVFLSVAIPAFYLKVFQKVSINELKKEFKSNNKYFYILGGALWSTSLLCLMKAYQIQDVSKVASLGALQVLLSVVFAYVFLKERSHISKKIFCALIILLGVYMTNL